MRPYERNNYTILAEPGKPLAAATDWADTQSGDDAPAWCSGYDWLAIRSDLAGQIARFITGPVNTQRH